MFLSDGLKTVKCFYSGHAACHPTGFRSYLRIDDAVNYDIKTMMN